MHLLRPENCPTVVKVARCPVPFFRIIGESTLMSYAHPPGSTFPNYRTTRLLGIFSIVFASCLMIAGLCMSVSVVIQPMILNAMGEAQKKVEERGESVRKGELEDLAKAAEAAKTDAEKAQIDVQRKEIEARPKAVLPGMVDMSKLFNQPLLQGWTWVEIITGLAVNIAMLVSGIGLLKYRGWARNLAVWTALLKIGRLALVYGFFIIAVVPPMSKTIGEYVSQMMVQQQGMVVRGPGVVPDASMFTKIYTITYSVMGAGMIAIGSIFPAVMLYYLTRPRVKAACEVNRKPLSGRDEL